MLTVLRRTLSVVVWTAGFLVIDPAHWSKVAPRPTRIFDRE